MSWAGSINTQNCFERYAFSDQSFAPTPRRGMERSTSTLSVPRSIRFNQSAPTLRSQSASPAPSAKRSFFSLSSKFERSKSEPQAVSVISAPVLISSTNPLVTTQQNTPQSCDSTAWDDLCESPNFDDILEKFDDEEEEEEEEDVEQTQEDARFLTSLSPAPLHPNKALPRLSKKLGREHNRESQISVAEIQIQHPQPRSNFSTWPEAVSECGSQPGSHFSMWSDAGSEVESEAESEWNSRCTSPTFSEDSFSPTESVYSRRESDASFFASNLPAGQWFDYNPYVSKVAERGFQVERSDTVDSIEDIKQITALEDYLDEVGL